MAPGWGSTSKVCTHSRGTALVQRCLGAIYVYMVEGRREGREEGREERSRDGEMGKGWERR